MNNVIQFYKSDLGKAWVARAHAEFFTTWLIIGLAMFTVVTVITTVTT